MSSSHRGDLLLTIARHLVSQDNGRPLRVGIDGVGAAGKTHFADELAPLLEDLGRPVIRAGVDGFHRPAAERHRRGRDDIRGYYYDSFDHEAMIEAVLAPLGPDGSRRYRVATFDLAHESSVDSPTMRASEQAILLFEGVFLFRPELVDHFDCRIFLDVPFDTALARAEVRDAERLGGKSGVRDRYHTRYIPGQRLYLDLVRPQELADLLIDNANPDQPVLLNAPLLLAP